MRTISERLDNLLDGLLIMLGGMLFLAFLAQPQQPPEPQQWTAREQQYLGDGLTAYSYPALGYRTPPRLDVWLTEEPTTR